ncbi:hypothetical protein ACH0C8_16145, partial [Acetobacter lovaniensis]|uniref:hypothetical protein n=1 Tax=Acetobacter lovaniensis TaxID=104100 RepID=UPI00376FC019
MWRDRNPGASDIGLLAMLEAAKTSIKISQMEIISPPSGQDGKPKLFSQFISVGFLNRVGQALKRGVK